MTAESKRSAIKRAPAPTARAHYHHGDLPRALREVSLKILAEVGPETFTLREAARRAGVNQMMTLQGTKALFSLFESAPLDMQRLRPQEVGVPRIGHFGFFRESMEDKLWPLVPAWASRDAAATSF